MPDDDERSRRRLGDATKSRIADLAAGWDAPGKDTEPSPKQPAPDPEPAPAATAGSTRPKRKTDPPPPPGSPERRALEETIVATTSRDEGRVGDATRSRIAELASGWSVDAPSASEMPPAPAVAPAGGPTRSKPKTNPPPPPGSRERQAIEEQIVATTSRDDESTDVLPPERRRSTGVQAVVADRIQAPTGSRPDAGARSRTPTGSQPVGDRLRTPTGSQPVGDRPRSSTGAQRVVQPVVPPTRPKLSTGSQSVVGDRSKVSTGSHGVVGDRPKPPSIPPLSAAALERTRPPSIPPPAVERSKLESYPPAPPAPAPRSKPVSTPPPPPSGDRSKPASVPPPAPGSPERAAHERSKPSSIPPKPSGPKYQRAGYDGPESPLATPVADDELRPFTTEARTPAVIVDADAFAGNKLPAASGELKPRVQSPAKQVLPVPTGEFDGGVDTKQQTTARRDAAEAILAIPDAETPVDDLVDDDDGAHEEGAQDPHAAHDVHDQSDRRRARVEAAAASNEPRTSKFERGDPTDIGAPDATEIQAPRSRTHMTGGTLRRSAALRRKRGLYGDVRYVFTALFGVRRSRQELGELEHRQEVRAVSRRRHLITAGRAAATMDNFDHPALGRARDTLSLIEEERAKHQGAVAASDAELDRVRRDRATNVKAHAEAIVNADAEIAELAKKLEPLEKEAGAARRKSAELRDELHRIDKKIADTEALLVSVKGEKLDKAGVQADIATFKANKQAVLRDEPAIAAQLDQLNPQMAALEATRSELQKKKLELDKSDQDDQRRTLELLEAIGAKRKVVERASADAEVARDNALFELGDRLYVDRPKQLTPELSPIDRIDLEIGEDERRAMEIKEILSNIDKAKFARGMAMIILALGAVGTLAWLIYSAT